MAIRDNDRKPRPTPIRRSVRLRPLNVAVHAAIAGGLVVGTLPGGLRAELPSPAAAWSAPPPRPSPSVR